MNLPSDKKYNILYHHRTQGRGAEGVHITSIVRSLESMGHTVTVLSPPGIDPMLHAGNAPVDKSKVKTSGLNSLWKFISKNLPNFMFELIEVAYNLTAMRRLESELSKNKYDLIYERYAFYMIAGAIKAKKYNIPLILEVNEVNGIKERARKQSFPAICNYFERYLVKRCRSIHTVSSYLKKLLLKHGIDENCVIVTPNGIDPQKFAGKTDSSNLREKYKLNGRKVIGFAGWFDEWDRLDLMFEAYVKLKREFPDLALLLIGDGQVLDDIRRKRKELNMENDIILTGAVKRDVVHNYISMLDIAIITHSNEFGSPVIMFEFMGLKIPIIAPLLLPITDVLKDNETALLFEVMNMEDMMSRVKALLMDSDLAAKIADSAYADLMEYHTWDHNAKAILSTAGLE